MTIPMQTLVLKSGDQAADMNRNTGRTITADTGIPLLALFVAMVQADSLNKVQVQNLGLGICREIAAKLDGRMSLYNIEPNRFRFCYRQARVETR